MTTNIAPLLISQAEQHWAVALDGTPNPEASSCIDFGTDFEAAHALATLLAPRPNTRVLQFVTSKPLGPDSDFVEVEDLRGVGVALHGWHARMDGMHVLFMREAL